MAQTEAVFEALLVREVLCEPGLTGPLDRVALRARWGQAVGAPEGFVLAGALAFPAGLGRAALLPLQAQAAPAAGEGRQARYDACCRAALGCAAGADAPRAFELLRQASAIDDAWARHHQLYGLVHGARGDVERARFELGLALRAEPHADARRRIAQALAVPDREARLSYRPGDDPALLDALLASGRPVRLALEGGPPASESPLWGRLRLCRGGEAVAAQLGAPRARAGLGRLASWAAAQLAGRAGWAHCSASLRPSCELGPALLRLEPEEA